MAKKSNREWFYWLLACLFIIAVLWLFYGGESQEFIGLPAPREEIVEEEVEVCEPPSIKTPRTPNIPFHELNSKEALSTPINNESNGERITRRVFETLFGKPFKRVRPDFLFNPETKRNLELDGYNEELKIAFEYNGPQHYHYPNAFVKTEQEFHKLLRRDRFKLERCNELGIYLVIVPYSVKHENILHDVWHKLHPDIRKKCVYSQ